MKRPSIKIVISATVLSLVAVTTFQSWLQIGSMNVIERNNDKIVNDLLPSVSASKETNVAKGDLALAYANHILATTDKEQSKAEEDIRAAQTSFKAALASYEQLVGPNDADEIRMVDELKGYYANYVKQGNDMLAFSRKNENDDAKNVFQKMAAISDKMDVDLDKLVEINATGATHGSEESRITLQSAFSFVYILAIIAGLIAVGAVYFAISGIATPVSRITASMKRLAEGDTENEIPFYGRADEIGDMAGAVEVFRQAAISNKRLQAEAHETRKRAEAERIDAQRRAEEEAAERMRIATSGLAAGLKRLASGDLAFQLNDAFAPDFEALRRDFNQSICQLGSAMSSIAGTVSTIENGTREIASGANDLSRRTEQQAASLEETAAAVEEITSNVQNSTKRTEDARKVAREANQSATKSAEVVSHAEEAMRKIEESSRQISNIIGVIDEIAFQTNLLALNAGVEAARAGDAGKGFAVVAQEVRELAQRAASAAKEIKGLIQNSSSEVNNGVKLVRDAGEALKTIGGFIAEMNDHMESIATSAREQSTGLEEVNRAVNSMDQTTQQNAALVEESNAASNTLAKEAFRLRDLVSQFKLEGMSLSQPTALRQTARNMTTPESVTRLSAVQSKIAGAGGAHWQEF